MEIRISAEVTLENKNRRLNRTVTVWAVQARDGARWSAREGSVCHSGCPSKRALSLASLWGCPHQSLHLATASIDHLHSFIPPIKMLSVHITFVFLWWTLLLLHKDTVVMNMVYFWNLEENFHWGNQKVFCCCCVFCFVCLRVLCYFQIFLVSCSLRLLKLGSWN